MRASLVVALVALTSTRSIADSADERARRHADAKAQVAAIVAAFADAGDTRWATVLEPTISLQDARFSDRACDKAFHGEDVKVRVTQARRAALVRCLTKAPWRPLASDDMSLIEPFDNMYEAFFPGASVQLRPRVEPKRAGEAGELRIFRIQVR